MATFSSLLSSDVNLTDLTIQFAHNQQWFNSYYIWGVPGSGKTTWAANFGKKWLEGLPEADFVIYKSEWGVEFDMHHEESDLAYFIRFPELCALATKSAGFTQEAEKAWFKLDNIKTTRLLILDDFFCQKPTDTQLQKIDDLIDYRATTPGLQTIFTSNYSIEELNALSPHLASRVQRIYGSKENNQEFQPLSK